MKDLIAQLIHWYQDKLDSGGYGLIALLMALESTVLPIPSELVIPFAAQRAQTSGRMAVWAVVLAGTIGSVLGASIMYWVARWAGRPLVLRYGRYAMVSESKFHAAEEWSRRFGSFGVFLARLLPVVRHLIGIPMGIVEMDFRLYSLFTLLGSGLWCGVLAWVGIKAGSDEKVMHGDLLRIMMWLLGIVIALSAAYYFLVQRVIKKKRAYHASRKQL